MSVKAEIGWQVRNVLQTRGISQRHRNEMPLTYQFVARTALSGFRKKAFDRPPPRLPWVQRFEVPTSVISQ
jgi:hypothetical protein